MVFSSQVTSVTRTFIVPEIFSQINLGSPFLFQTLAEAKDWDTGTAYELPIKYAISTNGGVTGIADQLDSNRQTNRTKMTFQPKSAYKPVVVADIEVELNKGDERVISLVAAEMHSQAQDLCENQADYLYGGTGAGDEWDSIVNAADDGTNYSTYGGLSRTTYPALDGYYIAAVGAQTLAKLATAYDAVEKGTDSPTGMFTTKSLWSGYEALLTPTTQAHYSALGDQVASMTPDGIVVGRNALSGTQGFKALTYRGTPYMKDEHCPSGKIFLVNTRNEGKFRNFGYAAITRTSGNFSRKNFAMKAGDPQGTFGSSKIPKGFNFRDMMSPVDQLSEVGYLLFDGNFLAAQPRLQGQMVGVT